MAYKWSNFGRFVKILPQVTRTQFMSISSHVKSSESKTGSLVLLAMPIVAFGLGTWQVYRLQWKKSLIQQLEDRTMAEPIELDNNLDIVQSPEMQYRRVKIKGIFEHTKEIHLFPRTLNTDNRPAPRTNTIGAHIITPFQLSNTGQIILVNRGWVDKSQKDAETRKNGQITDEVELVAFMRQGETRPQFVPENDIENNIWRYRDIDQMAKQTGSLPILVDADAASTIKGGPVGGQTRVTLRNEHLQYIVTWYGLAFATALMYYHYKRPKIRR